MHIFLQANDASERSPLSCPYLRILPGWKKSRYLSNYSSSRPKGKKRKLEFARFLSQLILSFKEDSGSHGCRLGLTRTLCFSSLFPFGEKYVFPELTVKQAKEDHNSNLFQEARTHRTGISFNLYLSITKIIKIYSVVQIFFCVIPQNLSSWSTLTIKQYYYILGGIKRKISTIFVTTAWRRTSHRRIGSSSLMKHNVLGTVTIRSSLCARRRGDATLTPRSQSFSSKSSIGTRDGV